MRALSLSFLLGGGWILPALAVQSYAGTSLEQKVATEEVVITGTRTEQSVWDSPVKVSLVNRVEIEKLHATNAYEALKNVPGLDFKQPHGKEGQNIMIQGVSGNRVLVLIDGEPVSKSTGSSTDLTQIAATQIERIEIVKGAVSALYGSSAIGGVVNIITANPKEGLHASFSADVGSWGKRDDDDGYYYVPKQRYDGSMSFATSQLALQFGVNAVLSNGFMSGRDWWEQPSPSGEQISTYTKATWYMTDEVKHSLRHEYYMQEWETRYSEKKGANTNYLYKVDDVDRHTLRYSGDYMGELVDINWGALYEDFVNKSNPSPSVQRKAQMGYSSASVQLDHRIGTQQFTHGFEYSHNTLESFKDNESELDKKGEFSSFEYYFQDQITLGRLQILPGFRYQYDNLFGTEISPKLNARLDLLETQDYTWFLRSGVGKGYRVPNLKELYYLFDHSVFGYMVLGNENLQPEKAINYQIELGLITQESFSASLNLFYNDLEDMIVTEDTGTDEGGINLYRYVNTDKARTQGIELNMEAKPFDWLGVRGGYVYLDAKDISKDRRLGQRSRHQAKLSLDLVPYDRLSLSLNSRFYSDQLDYPSDGSIHKTPPFSVIDTKINYQLIESLKLYAGVDNATDITRDYDDDYDKKPRDGRYFYTGFAFNY